MCRIVFISDSCHPIGLHILLTQVFFLMFSFSYPKWQICNYPFTTKGILMGHIAYNFRRFQVCMTFSCYIIQVTLVFSCSVTVNALFIYIIHSLLQVTDTPGLLTRHDGKRLATCLNYCDVGLGLKLVYFAFCILFGVSTYFYLLSTLQMTGITWKSLHSLSFRIFQLLFSLSMI